VVTWSLKKQPIMVLSMMEAKYVEVVHVTKEAIWLGAFTGEFTTPPAIPTIIPFHHSAVQGQTAPPMD